jgi:hypothetical protein
MDLIKAKNDTINNCGIVTFIKTEKSLNGDFSSFVSNEINNFQTYNSHF